MAQMLLINPRKRRSATKKRRATPARAKRRVSVKRRKVYASNPLPAVKTFRRRIKRVAGKARRAVRRRRNPISMRGLNMAGITRMLKTALIGGAGAVSVDLLMAQVNKYLPASMQPTAQPGLNNAVKAALTVVLGSALSKPTRGMSEQMAAGALAVQAADVVRYTLARFMPSAGVSGIGYAVPAYVTQGTARVGPAISGMGRYVSNNGGTGPMLSRFESGSPVLNSANTASRRESVLR